MNRRDQTIVSDEALVAHIVKNYTYDRERGVVVNRKLNRVVKGSVNSVGYMHTRIRLGAQFPTIRLHHMVWVLMYGRLPTQIDHINGDKTDNRQLGRRVGAFDKDVYAEIVKILSKLLVENGNSED